MSSNRHECTLPHKDTSGLPKLAPNASWAKKLIRHLRKLILMNPNHHKCKELFRNKAAVIAERKTHATGPHFFVIHPMSAFNAVVELTFVIVWFYSLIVIPLALFMDKEDKKKVYSVQRYVISSIQMILIVLFFNIGYIDKITNRVILQPRKIISRYLLTYFVFDYFSTHFSLELLLDCFKIEDQATESKWKLSASLIRTICFSFRIPVLLKFIDDCLRNLKFKRNLRNILHYALKTYLYLHLFTFIIYLIPNLVDLNERDSEKSWNKKLLKTVAKRPERYELYMETLRMVACYFFGIAYEDEMEVMLEQICMVIVSFFGRLYTLFLLADILRMFGIAGVSESRYERGMSLMQNYMANQDVPESLRQRILRFYEFKFQGRYFKEDKIIDTLSENLRTELFLFSARKMIQKVEIFKKLPSQTVGFIIGAMKSETYSPKDIIVTIGSEVSEIYFISSGTVAVMDTQGTELCHLEDGDVFGTTCLFLKKQVYAVVAIETTEIFIINKNQFIEFLQPYSEVMNVFYRTAKDKFAKWRKLEDNVTMRKVDPLSQLKSGNILEKRTKRITVVD